MLFPPFMEEERRSERSGGFLEASHVLSGGPKFAPGSRARVLSLDLADILIRSNKDYESHKTDQHLSCDTDVTAVTVPIRLVRRRQGARVTCSGPGCGPRMLSRHGAQLSQTRNWCTCQQVAVNEERRDRQAVM